MDNDTADMVNTSVVFRDEPCLEDLSDLADKTLAIADSMLKNTNDRSVEFIKTVLLDLMMAEKRCRVARDGASNARICKYIIQILYDMRDFSNLNYYLVLLSRKRGQLKATISATVRQAIQWIDDIEDREAKTNLIKTLNHVTFGKMYLEKERADLAFSLASILEMEGNIPEAAKVVQNCEVDTFGSVGKKDRVRFILDLMRLQLLNKDYLRVYITSQKINKALLNNADYVEEKFTFYTYMIKYYLSNEDYFEIAKAYQKRMEATLEKGAKDWIKEMECMLIFLIIAPINNETIQFRTDLLQDERLSESPLLARFFKDLLSDRMISLPIEEDIASALKQHAAFSGDELPGGRDRLEIIHDRVIQHSIMVAHKFYTHIELKRLAELINTSREKLEKEIAAMVNRETICAKLNRPEGLVKFGKKKSPDAVLDNWSSDIATLLSKAEQCSRLALKERMILQARNRQLELEQVLYH